MHEAGRSRFPLILTVCALIVSVTCASSASAAPRQRRQVLAKQVTKASWYGKSFRGRRTANGTIFNPQRLTAAHPSLDIGSHVKVTELRSGRSVVVQITDRGPYLPGRGIDLSYAAARELGIVQRGVARVRVELVERENTSSGAPIVTASGREALPRFLKALVE